MKRICFDKKTHAVFLRSRCIAFSMDCSFYKWSLKSFWDQWFMSQKRKGESCSMNWPNWFHNLFWLSKLSKKDNKVQVSTWFCLLPLLYKYVLGKVSIRVRSYRHNSEFWRTTPPGCWAFFVTENPTENKMVKANTHLSTTRWGNKQTNNQASKQTSKQTNKQIIFHWFQKGWQELHGITRFGVGNRFVLKL